SRDDGGDRRGPLSGPPEGAAARGAHRLLRGARGAGAQEEALDLGASRLAEAPDDRGDPGGSAARQGSGEAHPAAAWRTSQKRAGHPPLRAPRLPPPPRARGVSKSAEILLLSPCGRGRGQSRSDGKVRGMAPLRGWSLSRPLTPALSRKGRGRLLCVAKGPPCS